MSNGYELFINEFKNKYESGNEKLRGRNQVKFGLEKIVHLSASTTNVG